MAKRLAGKNKVPAISSLSHIKKADPKEVALDMLDPIDNGKYRGRATGAWVFSLIPFVTKEIPIVKQPVEVTMKAFRTYLRLNLPEVLLEDIPRRGVNGERMYRSDPATQDCWKMASAIARAIESGLSYKQIILLSKNNIPSKGEVEKKATKGSLSNS